MTAIGRKDWEALVSYLLETTIAVMLMWEGVVEGNKNNGRHVRAPGFGHKQVNRYKI